MTTEGWRVGSLFAGIGGFDLAARNVGWKTAWVSEIDPYASAVIKKHFPDAPNHGDITQIDFTRVEPVEVLCGGFPCQDISIAGRQWGPRQGLNGARSGLWSEYKRAIGDLRPRYVVVENSPELLRLGFERVLSDLAALGYDAEWDCIPGYAVGAPHRRDRFWMVAYPGGQGRVRPFEQFGALSLSTSARFPLFGDSRASAWDALVDDCQSLRARDGISPRLDGRRLRGCGNAVIPQIPEAIFRAIQAHEEVGVAS